MIVHQRIVDGRHELNGTTEQIICKTLNSVQGHARVGFGIFKIVVKHPPAAHGLGIAELVFHAVPLGHLPDVP